MIPITATPNGVSFAVKVVPRAKKNALGQRDNTLLVHLNAPPVEGKANAALIAYLSELFKVRKSQIEIKLGEKSRSKVVCISGLDVTGADAIIKSTLGYGLEREQGNGKFFR